MKKLVMYNKRKKTIPAIFPILARVKKTVINKD